MMQLKAQIYAYRILARSQALPPGVAMAAQGKRPDGGSPQVPPPVTSSGSLPGAGAAPGTPYRGPPGSVPPNTQAPPSQPIPGRPGLLPPGAGPVPLPPAGQPGGTAPPAPQHAGGKQPPPPPRITPGLNTDSHFLCLLMTNDPSLRRKMLIFSWEDLSP